MTEPKTRRQLLRSLGIFNWLLPFIPHLAQILAPLRPLTRTKVRFRWTTEHTEAFLEAKRAVQEAKILKHPNDNIPYYLMTDASDTAMGAVLMQPDKDGNLCPVAYYSKLWNEIESRYITGEQECLAVVRGIHHYRAYLQPKRFFVITDHRNLKFLFQKEATSKNKRLQRWALQLSPYDFTLIQRPGTEMVPADYFSTSSWV